MNTKYPSWFNSDTAILLIRIAVGVIFLMAGIFKLTDIQMIIGFFGTLGLPAFLAWVVAVAETLGGAAVLFGIWSRLAAIGLAIIMIGALVTTKWGMASLVYHELEFTLLMANLAILMMGPGRFAVTKERTGGVSI